MAILYIPAETAVASPSSFVVDVYPVGTDTDRNALGARVIDRIALKRKLVLGWNYLSSALLATLLTSTGGTTFTVKYHDPVDNALKTITCKRDSVSMGVLIYRAGVPVWNDVRMTLDEQ